MQDASASCPQGNRKEWVAIAQALAKPGQACNLYRARSVKDSQGVPGFGATNGNEHEQAKHGHDTGPFRRRAKPRAPKANVARLPVQKPGESYTAADIEVLEGLEPVRRRPGMYIGGTDEKAMHHLFAEVIDNAMDEAVAGHASFIEVALEADGTLCVTDNGRGIPVDPHPKYPGKSALEVIMTTLHSGGKFNSNVYSTSGGLHGVGVSVVNALSEHLEVEVARGGRLYRQTFAKGAPHTAA